MERVEWKGGPLDGCVQRQPSNRFKGLWWGPNPAPPNDQLVWYELQHERTPEGKLTGARFYKFLPKGPPLNM